jgi:hypothetical protein
VLKSYQRKIANNIHSIKTHTAFSALQRTMYSVTHPMPPAVPVAEVYKVVHIEVHHVRENHNNVATIEIVGFTVFGGRKCWRYMAGETVGKNGEVIKMTGLRTTATDLNAAVYADIAADTAPAVAAHAHTPLTASAVPGTYIPSTYIFISNLLYICSIVTTSTYRTYYLSISCLYCIFPSSLVT